MLIILEIQWFLLSIWSIVVSFRATTFAFSGKNAQCESEARGQQQEATSSYLLPVVMGSNLLAMASNLV